MYKIIKNQNIYYQKIGRGKDLILIHGWGADVSTFWPIVDLLKDNFTLWLIDLPGFGRSDLPQKKMISSDYAEIISRFIKEQKIKSPIVLGHSFGGKITIKLASLYPNLVDKIILVGASGVKPYPSFKRLVIYPLAKIVHYLVPNIFNIKSIIRNRFYRRIESDYYNVGVLRDSYLKTIKEDLTSDLKKINKEALIIWGDEDRAVPLKYGKIIYQLLKNSKLIVLEGKGHFLHVHDSERFAYYVKDFS